MKKILIAIILLFSNIIGVYAKATTYYSNYSDFGEYKNNSIEANDLINVKENNLYRYYKEEKILGDYALINEPDSVFPYTDLTDSIKTDYSEWSNNPPVIKAGRKIEVRDAYYYQDMEKVRYIHITNVDGSDNRLKINELIVEQNFSYQIPYTIICDGCSPNFLEGVTNGRLANESSYIEKGGYLRIVLNDYYDLSELSIRFYVSDFTNAEKKYEIKTSREAAKDSDIFSTVLTKRWFRNSDPYSFVECQYSLSRIPLVNPRWSELKRSDEPLISTITRKVTRLNEYRYQDTLYRQYGIKRTYYDKFDLTSPLGFPIKDEETATKYYASQKRDKATIENDIVITDKNQKLEDSVLENTTNSLKIESNIDYHKNGLYKASFILPFIQIDRVVVVNIKENNNEEKGDIKIPEEPIIEEVPKTNPTTPVEKKVTTSNTSNLKRSIIKTNKPKLETDVPVKEVEKKISTIPKPTPNNETKSRNYLVVSLILLIVSTIVVYLKKRFVNKLSE
ncbi:MAG: hypothetical protein PHI05_03860 [Bacilli bacterium]|nr:hypothetical protein [Bacilli bacterium]